MTKKTVHVRDVAEKIWRQFKSEAALRGLKLNEALEQAIKEWKKETRRG